jgi:site-specific DNA-methyltransferase (adenine-specific)
MTPYYEDAASGITIYHGDCRDVIGTTALRADLVVTDPPFYLPARISASRRTWPRTLSEVAIMESFFRDAFREIVGIINDGGAVYTFCDSTSYTVFNSVLYPLVDRTHCLVWDKGKGGLGNGWRHSHELIVHGALPGARYADGFRRDVLECSTVASIERSHASEKPVELLSSLITAHPTGCVFDPFMGTGATLVAAQRLGRRAIGIELEERYCEIAAKRLQQAVLPLQGVA